LGYFVSVPASVPEIATHSGVGPSDAALVVAARAGEGWAMEAIFRRHAGMVNRLAFRLLGRDDDVDDLVQETFARALGSLDKLAAPQAFAAWLAGITVRNACKMLRRRRMLTRLGIRHCEPIDVDAVVSRTAPPDVATELRAIYRILDSFPPRVRLAIVLRKVDAMPLDEIASAMGTSLSTVKRCLVRAEQLLVKETVLDFAEARNP
jgi:RNA polymerase sigma-70 factor (ECF subfamily)